MPFPLPLSKNSLTVTVADSLTEEPLGSLLTQGQVHVMPGKFSHPDSSVNGTQPEAQSGGDSLVLFVVYLPAPF